ncbi:MAG TPA: kinase [Candidatus Pelethocola excrementipullorum]|nr:kinase [Candidatus Pelethocola excrementipullorum]
MAENRLMKLQNLLKDKNMEYTYVEEDGCGSIDFMHRGLSYHIWEYADEDVPCGVETNIFHAGRSEDIEGDYEAILSGEIQSW